MKANPVAKRSALDDRVRGVNRAHAYAMELLPRLKDAFRPFVGTKIEKVGGSLTAKVKAVVDALDLPCDGRLHVYRYQSSYSLVYVVKTCESGERHCFYHEASVYVGEMDGGVLAKLKDEPFDLRTDYTADGVELARERYREAKRLADEAHSALYPFGEFDR